MHLHSSTSVCKPAPKRLLLPGGRVLAAPSWVIPGTLFENCAFLDSRVDEAGLLFFETAACLAYTERDLPLSLASLSLSFHVHLPVDLPWNNPREAARICSTLLQKIRHLARPAPNKKEGAVNKSTAMQVKKRQPGPEGGLWADGVASGCAGGCASGCASGGDTALNGGGALAVDASVAGVSAAGESCQSLCSEMASPLPHCRAVLHPPAEGAEATRRLEAFANAFSALGGDIGAVCLENIAENSLLDMREAIAALGFGVCLDTGHMLTYGQKALLAAPELMARVGIVHCNAPAAKGPGGGHGALTLLCGEDRQLCRTIFSRIPAEAVCMLELFSWEELEASFPVLASWLLPQA